MANMTGNAIIAAARERADAVRSTRWDDTDLSVMLTALWRREVAHIHNVNPQFYQTSQTVSALEGGLYPFSSLGINAGSKWKRPYRVTAVRGPNGVFYKEVSFNDNPSPGTNPQNNYTWMYAGGNIYFDPAVEGDQFTIWYNETIFYPFVSPITFPEGYEHVLIYGLAGEMLLKGGAETGASNDLFRLRDILREDMLQDIRRIGASPRMIRPADNAGDWGSQ